MAASERASNQVFSRGFSQQVDQVWTGWVQSERASERPDVQSERADVQSERASDQMFRASITVGLPVGTVHVYFSPQDFTELHTASLKQDSGRYF